jgi:hypothetical protein
MSGFRGSGLFRRKSMETIFHQFNLKDAWDVLFLLERINNGMFEVISRSGVSSKLNERQRKQNLNKK